MEIKSADQTLNCEASTGPICPWCKHDIETVNYAQIQSTFGKRYLYYCPHCRATLGVSHRKGFWMG